MSEQVIIQSYLGLDPGATGAAAMLISTIDSPGPYPCVFAFENQTLADFADWLDDRPMLRLTAVVEKQAAMPKQGVTSVFALGQRYGELLGILVALRIPFHLVAPGIWKRFMGVTSDKASSRTLARQLWPTAPLARVKDHGVAEALLIAEYGRRRGL